jgi:hypothetical protein
MSWDTQAWAAKQRPTHPADKLILIGMSSCSNADHEAYPSIAWLVDWSGYDRKTVIVALQRLAGGLFPLIEDTGRRVGRSAQIKVWRLSAEQKSTGTDLGTVPKVEHSQKRDSTTLSRRQSQKRDTEPVLEPIPISPDKSGEPPLEVKPIAEVKKRATAIPDDWTPPPIAGLTPQAAAYAAQWPTGAYEAHAEAFVNHWQSSGRANGRKLDWHKTWSNWVARDHSTVMRDKKYGIVYAAPAALVDIKPGMSVAAQLEQCPRSAAIRRKLETDMGAAKFASLFGRSAIVIDAKAVRIIAPSEFMASQIERGCGPAIEHHARAVVGAAYQRVKYETGPLMIVCGDDAHGRTAQAA